MEEVVGRRIVVGTDSGGVYMEPSECKGAGQAGQIDSVGDAEVDGCFCGQLNIYFNYYEFNFIFIYSFIWFSRYKEELFPS